MYLQSAMYSSPFLSWQNYYPLQLFTPMTRIFLIALVRTDFVCQWPDPFVPTGRKKEKGHYARKAISFECHRSAKHLQENGGAVKEKYPSILFYEVISLLRPKITVQLSLGFLMVVLKE